MDPDCLDAIPYPGRGGSDVPLSPSGRVMRTCKGQSDNVRKMRIETGKEAEDWHVGDGRASAGTAGGWTTCSLIQERRSRLVELRHLQDRFRLDFFGRCITAVPTPTSGGCC